jgi:hypothetical protein
MWGDTAACAVMTFHMSALPTIISGCHGMVATNEHQSCVRKHVLDAGLVLCTCTALPHPVASPLVV